MLTQILKSKTMWLAFAVELMGILQLVQTNIEELRINIPAEYYGYVLIGIGAAIRLLRLVTTSSLGAK